MRISAREPRTPQTTKAAYLEALQEAGFCAETREFMMTDAAPTFVSTGLRGIVDAHAVRHSDFEFVGYVEALSSTRTRAMRPALASTQMLDREWGLLKEILPSQLHVRSAAGLENYQYHVRCQQWLRMLASKDPRQSFAKLQARYVTALATGPAIGRSRQRTSNPCRRSKCQDVFGRRGRKKAGLARQEGKSVLRKPKRK